MPSSLRRSCDSWAMAPRARARGVAAPAPTGAPMDGAVEALSCARFLRGGVAAGVEPSSVSTAAAAAAAVVRARFFGFVADVAGCEGGAEAVAEAALFRALRRRGVGCSSAAASASASSLRGSISSSSAAPGRSSCPAAVRPNANAPGGAGVGGTCCCAASAPAAGPGEGVRSTGDAARSTPPSSSSAALVERRDVRARFGAGAAAAAGASSASRARALPFERAVRGAGAGAGAGTGASAPASVCTAAVEDDTTCCGVGGSGADKPAREGYSEEEEELLVEATVGKGPAVRGIGRRDGPGSAACAARFGGRAAAGSLEVEAAGTTGTGRKGAVEEAGGRGMSSLAGAGRAGGGSGAAVVAAAGGLAGRAG